MNSIYIWANWRNTFVFCCPRSVRGQVRFHSMRRCRRLPNGMKHSTVGRQASLRGTCTLRRVSSQLREVCFAFKRFRLWFCVLACFFLRCQFVRCSSLFSMYMWFIVFLRLCLWTIVYFLFSRAVLFLVVDCFVMISCSENGGLCSCLQNG